MHRRTLKRRLAHLGIATTRLAGRHLRWLGRALSRSNARLAVLYLVFLALLVGYGVGRFAHDGSSGGVRGWVSLPRPVGEPPPGHRWVEVLTTAYCPCAKCCGADADGMTSIGRPVDRFPYGIAAAPKLVPYRTWLSIPGYGEFMVDDTGGAMRQSAERGIVHLDLRFKTHERALQWGRRPMWIAIPDSAPAVALAE